VEATELAETTASAQQVAGRERTMPTWARAAAGPFLIVICVLFALRGFAFEPLLTNQHPDVLAFWLPRFAFLGRSLASGHVPLWNPFEMTGTPFAADPQSGWLYLPAMALFTWLGPGTAMRMLIVLNPLLGGLGLFWFLRREGIGRIASTAGGLSLGMLMSTSEIAISMPFAGAMAWTTLVMVGASGYRRSAGVPAKVAWLGFGALCWSQVASAHMSHGLVMCTALVAAYLLSFAIADARNGTTSGWRAGASVAAFLAFLPMASLAVLWPRFAFIRSSSLSSGYDSIATPLKAAAGIVDKPIFTNGIWAAWPLGFGATPGPYVGATILVCIPLAWRDRARRPLVIALGSVAALCYVLMFNAVVTAGWFRDLVLKVPFGDVYLHNPGRLRYLALLIVPALGAVGIQSLIDHPLPRRTLLLWLGVGALIWLVYPLIMGAIVVRLILLAVAIVAAGFALIRVGSDRRHGAMLVLGVLGAELIASAILSQTWQGGPIRLGLESGDRPNLTPQVLRYPNVEESQFLAPNRFVQILRSQPDRYLTWVPPAAYFEKGYLFTQGQSDWPALENERGTLFGVQDVLGYNPIQLIRYWSYIRAVDDLSIFYNASVINLPNLQDMRMLGARYLIVPHGVASPVPGDVVATQGGYDMVQVNGWEPRVSVVPSWTVVSGPGSALTSTVAPGFDPAKSAILGSDPGIAQTAGGAAGSATYSQIDPENVRIEVTAGAPSIVVVRNDFASGWSATVDGQPAPVLPTDAFLQGVAVSAGHHQIDLTYRDPNVARGLGGSAVALGGWALLLTGSLLRRRFRPQRVVLPA
jgi:hypothetical protein